MKDHLFTVIIHLYPADNQDRLSVLEKVALVRALFCNVVLRMHMDHIIV